LPGGPPGVEDGQVHESVLARADSERSLPRLGGMARPDGVIVVSERFWALARVDGSVREGAMPAAATAFRRVPLLRGLVRIAASVSPLFRRTGVARRPERLLLAAALLAPCGFFFLPGRLGVVAGLAVTVGLVAWLLRGRTLFLHGAEHRAIAAAEQRRLLQTWAGDARPSRFSLRCGTNFAVLVLPVAALADRLWPLPTTVFTPLVVAALALALTMELWLVVQASQARLARLFLLPGLGLQRLTTREPTLEETRVALRAVESVLRRELETAR
jgi:uncharacterized protein YqhQ